MHLTVNCLLSIWKFAISLLLRSRQFTAFTDHKPLTFCMTKVSNSWSHRQQRQLSHISEFTTDIRHVQGKENSVADTLSRATIADVQLGIDYGGMATAQQQDSEVQAYRTATSNLEVEDIPMGGGITLLCDTSTGHARLIVPARWRRQVFDIVHGLSHPSVRTTRKLVFNKFVWNGLQRQVGTWAKHCIACQSSKVQAHIRVKFSVPHGPGRTTSAFQWVFSPAYRGKLFLCITLTPAVALKP